MDEGLLQIMLSFLNNSISISFIAYIFLNKMYYLKMACLTNELVLVTLFEIVANELLI
jgi:hypothetical protein